MTRRRALLRVLSQNQRIARFTMLGTLRRSTMNAISFSLLMTGVLLNAGAQLLLKAGTNSVGAFEYSSANIMPVGWKLATEPHILGGLACYVISVVVWIMALSRVEVSIAYPLLSVRY